MSKAKNAAAGAPELARAGRVIRLKLRHEVDAAITQMRRRKQGAKRVSRRSSPGYRG